VVAAGLLAVDFARELEQPDPQPLHRAERVIRMQMPVDLDTMPDPRRAWRELEPAAAEAATASHHLVGLGCGAERKTYTAAEEDHFPAPCYAVDTPAHLCPDDEGDEPLAWECAAYLGDGW